MAISAPGAGIKHTQGTPSALQHHHKEITVLLTRTSTVWLQPTRNTLFLSERWEFIFVLDSVMVWDTIMANPAACTNTGPASFCNNRGCSHRDKKKQVFIQRCLPSAKYLKDMLMIGLPHPKPHFKSRRSWRKLSMHPPHKQISTEHPHHLLYGFC